MADEYYERGRDAKTGRIITVEEARRRKATAIVEKVLRKTQRRKGFFGRGQMRGK